MRNLDLNPQALLKAGNVESFADFDEIPESVVADYIIGNCMPEITALTETKVFYNQKGEIYFAENLINDLKSQILSDDNHVEDVGNAIWSDTNANGSGYVNTDENRFLTELIHGYRSFLTCLSRLNAGETLPLDELTDFLQFVIERQDLANFEDAFSMSSKDDAPKGADELVFRSLCNAFYCMNRN